MPAILGQSYGTAILQGQQRFLAFNVLRALPATSYAVAVLAIFVVGGGNLEWVVVGWIVASLVSAAVTLFVAFRPVRLRQAHRSPERLRSMLSFGIKGLLGWTSPVETFRLDQAVVGLFLTPAALGLYVVGLAFANLPRFIAQSVGYIAYPRIAGRRGDEAWKELWQFFWLASGAAALVVLALELSVAWLVPVFFGDEFSGAVPLTRILLIGALFLSARRVLTDGAQGLGRPGLGTIAEVSSWVFLLPALGIFTPLWNARGVALALTVSAALASSSCSCCWCGAEPRRRSGGAQALRIERADRRTHPPLALARLRTARISPCRASPSWPPTPAAPTARSRSWPRTSSSSSRVHPLRGVLHPAPQAVLVQGRADRPHGAPRPHRDRPGLQPRPAEPSRRPDRREGLALLYPTFFLGYWLAESRDHLFRVLGLMSLVAIVPAVSGS